MLACLVPSAFSEKHPFDILVVDDSEIGRKLTSHHLRSLGYAPAEAADGFEAVRMTAQRLYELIFMDLRMPGMDGRETLLRIFKEWRGPRRPFVIALTAEILDEERRQCIEVGMVGFLTKPCEPQNLIEAIGNLRKTPGAPALVAESPRAQEDWEQASVVNPAALRALRILPGAKKPTLLEELFETFCRETPQTLIELSKVAEAKDWPHVRRLLHQLTGNFDILGAPRMARLCRACSAVAKEAELSGSDASLPRLLEDFEPNFKALLGELEKWVKPSAVS